MTKCTILLILFVIVAEISGIPFEDCGSRYDLLEVDIAPCKRAPCDLTIGANVNVTTKFVANTQSQRLENNVFFFVNNVELDTSVRDHTCPAEGTCVPPNQTISYTAEMAVSEELPPVPGYLVWRIFNDIGVEVVCFRVAIYLIV